MVLTSEDLAKVSETRKVGVTLPKANTEVTNLQTSANCLAQKSPVFLPEQDLARLGSQAPCFQAWLPLGALETHYWPVLPVPVSPVLLCAFPRASPGPHLNTRCQG